MRRAAAGAGVISLASLFLWILLMSLASQGRAVQAARNSPESFGNSTSVNPRAITPSLRLNEIMVDNRSVLHDESGDFDSWIELHNLGLLPLDVGGMALSNKTISPELWLIPTDTVIPGHGYLLIWADGEPEEGELHAHFALEPGHVISLYDKQILSGNLIDHVYVSATLPDWSWARHPNGYGPWTLFDQPSPGTLNATARSYLPLTTRERARPGESVVLNEFMAANHHTLADKAGEYDDWIELYNSSIDDVDLSGMYLSDDLGNLTRWQIPAGTVISADGYLLLWADGQEEQGLLHTNFGLSRAGEMLLLVEADGHSLTDWITFTAQQDDISFGRLPDGADNWQPFSEPTPGGENALTPIFVSDTTHQPAAPGISDSVTVTVRVVAAYPPLTVTLFHDAGLSETLDGFVRTPMLETGDGLYAALIPPQPSRTTVRYYVHVRDALSQTMTDPIGAPDDVYRYTVDLPSGVLVINEFMAANSTVISDNAGDFDDWIELYNVGSTELDLSGYYLSDDLGEPTHWQIPAGIILPAKGHVLIWADDEPHEGPFHASFRLDADGESVGLFAPDGFTVIDALTYGSQDRDVSFGRYPDGAATWLSMITPTPGYTNTVPAPLINRNANTFIDGLPGYLSRATVEFYAGARANRPAWRVFSLPPARKRNLP